MTSFTLSVDSGTPDVADLYSQHHRWLERWLTRRTRCSAQAAELAQDTFVRVLMRRRQAGGTLAVDDPQAYLSTIARGLLIDEWRRRDIERAWLETVATHADKDVPGPEETVEILQILQRVDRMLAGLRPQVCDAFILARFDGLKCKDIAARLGISVATVERHVAHAMRRCYDLTFAE